MTEKLYYADSHLDSMEAVVLRCEEAENRFAVILDRTVFFPEGGGQPADTGTIDGIRVTDVDVYKRQISSRSPQRRLMRRWRRLIRTVTLNSIGEASRFIIILCLWNKPSVRCHTNG